MKTRPLYEVVAEKQDGEIYSSRICQTVRGARAWVRFLKQHSYIKAAKIYRGGAGGELVA